MRGALPAHRRRVVVEVPRALIAVTLVVPLLVPLTGPGPPAPAGALILSDLLPNAGETLPGGNQTNVTWNATHENSTWMWASLSYSIDGGGTYSFAITRGEFSTANASHPWQVPRFNTTGGRVRLCGAAPDGDTACVDSSANFTIAATAPYFDLLTPANNSGNVSLTATLAFGMEDVGTASVAFSISPPPPILAPSWSTDNRILFHEDRASGDRRL
ncbi:MAG: hypothetical protein AABY30_05350, partial [Candidatus Thermoplasmatota archaeon]